MAGIDKIYGSLKQYDEFYKWCEENNKDACRQFYTRDDYESENKHRPITNFSEEVDMWMLKNCNIKFVVERILDQYCIFKHKGYFGTKEFSTADNCSHGEIMFINDLVTYESDKVAFLKGEFEKAVDDYIKTLNSIKT